MKYVCDAPGGNTCFRIETEAEAAAESDDMRHAVEKFFRKEQEKAAQTLQPLSKVFFEQEIGLKAHIQREMPLFLTLRDDEGNPLVTAMLPPGGRTTGAFDRSSSAWRTPTLMSTMPTRSKRSASISDSPSRGGAATPIAAIDATRPVPVEGAKRVEIVRPRERLAFSARCSRAAAPLVKRSGPQRPSAR